MKKGLNKTETCGSLGKWRISTKTRGSAGVELNPIIFHWF